MRKRERENPCSVCGHYHKYEEGEVCGICGHRMPVNSDKVGAVHASAFPSEILPEFLYLGSYDNASRSELLKTQGISHILNTVPLCQNLYKNSFTYHGLQDEKILQFDDAIHILDQCEKNKVRVLVHCMSGKSRSPAIVIAYLMKRKGWRFAQSLQWVKERRPNTDISPEFCQQLQEFELKLYGSNDGTILTTNAFPHTDPPPCFSFGFPKLNNQPQAPLFNNAPVSSLFSSPPSGVPPQEFTFGAVQSTSSFSDNPSNQTGNDIPMDSS